MKDGLNIVRGQAQSGIGESPSVRIPHGEQYLWCDGELWTEQFADAARIWMSLDDRLDDRHILGESLRAWSCCPLEGYYMTAMLAAHELYVRLPYFTHGRVWPLSDFQQGFDPGALLGRGSAFAKPWRDSTPVWGETSLEPKMVWAELVRQRTAMATALLGALLQSCRQGPQVAWLVPVKAFADHDSVVGLVSFARAALPYDLKQRCRIRVYTGKPEKFLNEKKAHLVVIPEDLRYEAQAAVPSLCVLDETGRVLAGVVEPPFLHYATAVVGRGSKFPNALFDFSVRAQHLSKLETAIVAYDLAYASAEHRMDALIEKLFELSRTKETHYPWRELIRDEDWNLCTSETLQRLALEDAPTPDSEEFRACLLRALVEIKHEPLDPGVGSSLAKLAPDKRVQHIFELLDRKWIAAETASREFLKLPAPQIATVLASEAGAKRTAELTRGLAIPDSWMRELPQTVDPSVLLGLVEAGASGWRIAVVTALNRLTESPANQIDSGLARRCAEFFKTSDRLEEWVLASDVLARAGWADDFFRLKIWGIRDPEQRRRATEMVLGPRSRWFGPPPREWDEDVSDLLIEKDGLDGLGMDRLAPIAASYEDDWPKNLRAAINAAMPRDLVAGTIALVEWDVWLRWRLGCSPADGQIRENAWQWIARARRESKLEDWKQVVLDLRPKITGKELMERRRGSKRNQFWPKIPLMWDEQVRDLVELCEPDFGARFELAQLLGGSDAYAVVLSMPRIAGEPEPKPEWLSYLDDHPPEWPLPLEEAVALVGGTRHREQQARQALENSVFHVIWAAPERAIRVAKQHEMWNDTLITRIAGKLRPGRTADKRTLDVLNVELVGFKIEPPDTHAAKRYLPDHPNIAEMFAQGITRPPLTDRIYASLLNGAPDPVWKELANQVAGKESAIRRVAEKIRASTGDWDDVRRKGAWRIVEGAYAAHGRQLAAMPILELCEVILTDCSPGELVIQVARLPGLEACRIDPAFWTNLARQLGSDQRGGNRFLDSWQRVANYLDRSAAPRAALEAFWTTTDLLLEGTAMKKAAGIGV